MATKEKVEATTAVTEGAKAQKLDYTDWLLVDLRAELERRGSDKKGTKRALAMRLEGLDGQLDAEYDSSQSNEEPSPPSPPPRKKTKRSRSMDASGAGSANLSLASPPRPDTKGDPRDSRAVEMYRDLAANCLKNAHTLAMAQVKSTLEATTAATAPLMQLMAMLAQRSFSPEPQGALNQQQQHTQPAIQQWQRNHNSNCTAFNNNQPTLLNKQR